MPSTLNYLQIISELEKSLSPEFLGFPTIKTRLLQNNYQSRDSYPPRNIHYLENDRRIIEIALAGYKKEDIKIEYKNSIITVSGKCSKSHETYRQSFRGISQKSFITDFVLSEYDVITAVTFEDGILSITIDSEVPEEKKPKMIEIGYSRDSTNPQLLTENTK